MSRRRRYQADWPTSLGSQRRRFGRTMLILAVGIVLSVAAGTRLGRDEATPTAGPDAVPATTSTAVGTPTTATGPAPVNLERRADGWYLPADAGTLVRVERVIDGDTLVVVSAESSLRVRVFGIAAPEVNQRCGSDATARLRALAGNEVRLVADRRQQDVHGRELRYLFTTAGRSIDAALVAEGFASAWHDDGRFRDTLAGIETEARLERAGCLWSTPTP